jgi:UDP-N-acetylmuramoylalanine-D-glutamate ligase
MLELENKQIGLIGPGGRAVAACEFLRWRGAKLMAVDHANSHGQASERIHAAASLFTPCTLAGSLLKPVAEAAINATSGDVVLPAPACSSWDQFRNHQHRGEVLCQAVNSTGRGARGGSPNIHGINGDNAAVK